MKINLLIVTGVFAFLLSCNKNSNTGQGESGKITAVVQNGDTLSYVYDNQGRLINRAAPEGNAAYTYTSSLVTEKIDALTGPVTLIYELNQQGLVSKCYNLAATQFFTSYQYNADGVLITETYNGPGNSVTETSYHYGTAGDLDSAIVRQFNSIIQRKIFEFDTNQPNVIAAEKFGISIFGKDSPHLIKKQMDISPGGSTVTNSYAYEFDNTGRVTKIIKRQPGTSQEEITNYNY